MKNNLLDKFLAKGNKGVVGIEGFYKIENGRWNDGNVFIPVVVKGVELDGCNPEFLLTVVGGFGEISIKSPCEFIFAEEVSKVKELEARKRAKEQAGRKHFNHSRRGYGKPTVVSRRHRLRQYIDEFVPNGFKNEELIEEAKDLGVDLEKTSSWTGHRVDSLINSVQTIAFPDVEE